MAINNTLVPNTFGSMAQSTPALLKKKPAAPSSGLLAPAKITIAAPAATTPVAQPKAAPLASAPVYSPPSKGLVTTDLDSLRSGLEGVQTGLMNLQKQQSSPFPSAINGLITTSQERNQKLGQDAEAIAKGYAQRFEDVGREGARAQGGRLTTGTSPVAEGNAAIIAQTTAAQQQAIANAGNMELAGVEKALTAQNQAQTALSQGGQLAQPQLGAFGQGYYNPLDPNGGAAAAGGSNLNPINNVQSIAQQVINGQISPAQAYSMGGSVQNWQALLNSVITQMAPNFNVANAQGSFDARQQNTTTVGVTPTNVAAGAYGQFYPQSLELQAQLQNVEGLGGLLLRTASGGSINPFEPGIANNTIAWLKNQLSDADQQRFNSTLASFSGAASQLLADSSGQTPTAITQNISKISNGSLSLGALKAMVDQAAKEGRIKLNTAQQLTNIPGSAIGAPKVTSGSGNNPLGI